MPFCVPSAHLEPILKPQVGHVALLSPHWLPSVWAQGLQVQFNTSLNKIWGFPAGSVVKNPPAQQEMQIQLLGQKDPLPGEGNGNPLQYSCLGSPMDRGTWWVTYSPWSRKELDTTE